MPFFVCVSEEIINSEKRRLDEEDNKQMMILFLFGLILCLLVFLRVRKWEYISFHKESEGGVGEYISSLCCQAIVSQ